MDADSTDLIITQRMIREIRVPSPCDPQNPRPQRPAIREIRDP
jgi:hypothetical protein